MRSSGESTSRKHTTANAVRTRKMPNRTIINASSLLVALPPNLLAGVQLPARLSLDSECDEKSRWDLGCSPKHHAFNGFGIKREGASAVGEESSIVTCAVTWWHGTTEYTHPTEWPFLYVIIKGEPPSEKLLLRISRRSNERNTEHFIYPSGGSHYCRTAGSNNRRRANGATAC